MKFLIDAHLSHRLARWFVTQGHDAVATRDLPRKNATPDSEIIAFADRDGRVVITKDDDFVQSQARFGKPARLLVVTVGNCSHADLLALFDAHQTEILAAFEVGDCVQLAHDGVAVRRVPR